MKSLLQYINESVNNVQSVYKSLRKVKSVKDKWFLFYLTKEYMDMGYYDKSDEKKFKRAFDDVIEWFNGNANMQRIAKENELETSYDMILSYKKDKED